MKLAIIGILCIAYAFAGDNFPPQHPNMRDGHPLSNKNGMRRFFEFLGFGDKGPTPPPGTSIIQTAQGPCFLPTTAPTTTPTPGPMRIPICPFSNEQLQQQPQLQPQISELVRPMRPMPTLPPPEETEPPYVDQRPMPLPSNIYEQTLKVQPQQARPCPYPFQPQPPFFPQQQQQQPMMPYPQEGQGPQQSDLIPVYPYYMDSCGLPFVPPGFYLPDESFSQCGPSKPQVASCSTMEMFEKLKLKTVYTLIRDAGLEQLFLQTSNYTFFAPVDPAFEKLPKWFVESLRRDSKLLQAFLLNHFVKIDLPLLTLGSEFLVLNARAGGNRLRVNVYFEENDYRIYTVDGARILKGDITTFNGRLHIIDKVLTPNPIRNAAQYLAEIPDLSEFLLAITDSQLTKFFQGSNPITLFIPYNPAFKFFDYQSMAGNLTAIENFVNYHVVEGTYYSSGLLNGQYLTTNYNKEIKVSVSHDGFGKSLSMLNGNIKVLKADIPLVNGVAHIIERCIETEPGFFYFEEYNEFSFEFGSLKRNFVVGNNKNSEKQRKKA